jgi:hypothetical protein
LTRKEKAMWTVLAIRLGISVVGLLTIVALMMVVAIWSDKQ